jgi:phenylacetic acid degradation operon negative regulatory protein
MNSADQPAGSVQDWVPFFLAQAAPSGHPVTSAGIVRLMEAVGFPGASTRVSISRLCAAGTLERSGSGRSASYRLSPGMRQTADTLHRRVESFGLDVGWSDQWTLALVSVPDAQRSTRRRLQVQLAYLGFGRLREAVWLAARDCLEEVQPVLQELGLAHTVDVFHVSPGSPDHQRSLLQRCWNAESLATRYGSFLDDFTALRPAAARRALTMDETIIAWMRLSYAYEDLVRRDPELPPELLSTATRNLRKRAVALYGDALPPLRARAAVRVRDLLDGGSEP